MLFSSIFASCSNTESDEDLQLFQKQELVTEDSDLGEDPTPPPPPPPPPGYIGSE